MQHCIQCKKTFFANQLVKSTIGHPDYQVELAAAQKSLENPQFQCPGCTVSAPPAPNNNRSISFQYIDEDPKLRVRLNQWMSGRNYVIAPGQGLEFTHTSFAGGLFDIRNMDQFASENGSADDLSPEQRRIVYEKQEQEFLKIYGQAVFRSLQKVGPDGHYRKKTHKNGDLVFLSEKRTPIFRFFIDMDFESPADQPDGYASITTINQKIDKNTRMIRAYEERNLPDEAEKLAAARRKKDQLVGCVTHHDVLLEMVHTIQKELARFYPDLDPELQTTFIALSMPKRFQKDDVLKQKDGVHLIWPDIYVDREKAMTIRESIIYRLLEVYGPRKEGFNSWDDVVDRAVYEVTYDGKPAGGLRMIGSRKALRCKDCAVERQKQNKSSGPYRVVQCKHCDAGYVHNSRIYWPEYLLDANGKNCDAELAELVDPSKKYGKLMQRTSVRSCRSEPGPGYQKPKGAPIPVMTTPKAPPRRRRAGAKTSPEEPMHDDDRKGLSYFRKKKALANDHPWIPLFQEVIRTRFGDLYKEIVVHRAYVLPPMGESPYPWFLVTVRGTGQNYCMNKQGDHKSSTVWFMLTADGVQQRCFCKKEVERVTGVWCKNFKSDIAPIKDLPLFSTHVFPPMYHGVEHPTFASLKEQYNWDGMPVSFLPVLWNRLVRMVGDDNIVKGDDSMTDEMHAKMLQEIRANHGELDDDESSNDE